MQQHLSVPRLGTYVRACGGNLDQAVLLYRWNAEVAGSLWVALGHTEIVLRNALHDALTARHARLGRAGLWLDDPAGELSQRARDDTAKAKQRLQQAGATIAPGKIVAELSFGFWRFLLAKRYTAKLWLAMRPAFPHLPSADRRLLEEPVARLHLLRNRLAHHEPLISEPLAARYVDLLTVVGFVDPGLRAWVDGGNSLTVALAGRP